MPKDLLVQWEAQRTARKAQLRSLERIPLEAITLAISLDGVFAPMRQGAPAPVEVEVEAAGKQPKGPKGC